MFYCVYLITFGHSFKRKAKTIFQQLIIMKKILFLMLAVITFGSACAGNVSNSTTESSEVAAEKSGKVIRLTRASFISKVYDYEKNAKIWKYEGNKPAIVDFYATWCGPCKRVAPILEELAKEYDGKIVIYKVDTDQEKELARAFGITSIPTLLFIPMNGEPQVANGALPKENLKQAIDEFLLGNK